MTMTGRDRFVSYLALVAMAGLTGCTSAGSPSLPTQPSPQPTAVLFAEAPPKTLAVNATATIDALTTYPPDAPLNENTSVTYSLSCGSLNACGTLSQSDEVGAMLYTAPAAIPASGAVTVTATSVANPSLSASAAITIVPPIPITVSLLGAAPASLQVNASYALRAQITNDVSANPQVTWSVHCGGSACGSFSPTTTPNEEPATYTAPTAIPPANTVTITATSVTDSTKSASATIAITPQAPTLANGTYVFQVTGGQSNEATVVTGVLTAQNGAITGGEEDLVFGSDSYSQFEPIQSGSYSTTSDGNLEITINPGPGTTVTLTGTLTSDQKGLIGGIDGTPANGTLELQTSMAAPTGGYVFALDAADYYDGSFWMDGIVDVDGPGTISGNGSLLDVGEPELGYAQTQTLTASTVSAPDAWGRVLFKLSLAGGPLQSLAEPLDVAGYIVDGQHLRLIEVGNPQNSYVVPGEMGGVALAQGTSTGRFSTASVAGTSYVFGAEGTDQQGTLQLAGVVALNANGSATGTLNWTDLSGNSPQKPLPFSGTYTLDPTGRVTLTDLTDGSTFTYSMRFYLNGSGKGAVLSADQDDVFAGDVFQQQAEAFSLASFSGSYGLNASLYGASPDGVLPFDEAAGPLVASAGNGVDNVTGYADLGAGLPDFAVTGSFTPSAVNGVFTGTLSGFSASGFTLYWIDNTQGVLIGTGAGGLTLGRVATQ